MCHFLGVAYCVILSQKGNVTILDARFFLRSPSWEDLGYEMNSESPVLTWHGTYALPRMTRKEMHT